jgi:hypothetical protein
MAMQNFIQNFVREKAGAWACTEPAELVLPGGRRIQVAPGTRFTLGTTFMGIDLARMLDEEYDQQRRAR